MSSLDLTYSIGSMFAFTLRIAMTAQSTLRLHLAIFSSLLLSALSALAGIQSGPMLGPVSMREALVWLQTDSESFVRIQYRESNSPANQSYWTAPAETYAHNDYCITFRLSQVEPGKSYEYQVEVDGALRAEVARFDTPVYFQGKTPPPDITIAVIGAHYRTQDGFEPPYKTLGAGYDIFSTLQNQNPDLMIWAGHTAHLRASDWTSKSGYLKRYGYARATPEMQSLLAEVPNYATWGSADYGPAGAGESYSLKNTATDSFTTYWPQANDKKTFGIVSRFQRSDVDFFFLDVQSNRKDRPASDRLPEILGKDQVEWLREEIINSQATFKFIVAGAPILNPADNSKNLSFAEREQKQMLQMLREENISGLFFISGGKPFGELTRLVHANSYNLYDLTVGPVTAAPMDSADELNYFRMPGTSTFERSFALIDVTGPEEERMLTLRVINLEGTELWKQSIPASQLQMIER